MPPGDDGAGPIRIPPPIDTPPGAYCPFFISPVTPIIDPSCALISAISFFGPFIRRCMPSRISALDGGSSVRGPAVNTIPLVHPATYTRTESLGTGLVVSCAAGAAMDETAMATARAALMTTDLTAFCWLVVPECRPRQGSVATTSNATLADMDRAKVLMRGVSRVGARDAVDAAVMLNYDVERIATFGAGFD
jgi:hypothetical protein